MIHQHAKFDVIAAMSFPENTRMLKIWPRPLSDNCTQNYENEQIMTKI